MSWQRDDNWFNNCRAAVQYVMLSRVCVATVPLIACFTQMTHSVCSDVLQVRSRFADQDSNTEDFKPFLSGLKQLGFKLMQQDSSNKMFVVWHLQKQGPAPTSGSIRWPKLKACLYKRR